MSNETQEMPRPMLRPDRPDGARILLVDDEEGIYTAYHPELEAAGFTVRWAKTGEQGLELFRTWDPDVILLDLILPGMTGFEVCRRIRETSQISIIVLSVLHDKDYVKEALDAGASDYLVKATITMTDLIARLRVSLVQWGRITQQEDTAAKLARYGLTVDSQHRVSTNGRAVDLTPKEYELLRYLAQCPDSVVTYDTLLRTVWGPGYENAVTSLRVFISNVRQKIEPDPNRPRYLLSVGDVGYRLRAPE
jgi:two-component system KDP operon response regulator KdpE